MTDAIIELLRANPWLIYVYLGAMLLAVVLRAGWPEATERPRWVTMTLAACDLVQLNISGPAKLIVNHAQTGSVTRSLR